MKIKNKNGFIAMSLIFSFFIVFVAIMIAILVNFSHTRVVTNVINEEITRTLDGTAPPQVPDEPELPEEPEVPVPEEPKIITTAIQNKYSAISDINIDFTYSSWGCSEANATFEGTCSAAINQSQVTNGLYINMKSNVAGDSTLGKIKYFRGDVDNYVQFAGMLWRVIRIDQSGNVRLITEQTVLTNTPFNPAELRFDGTGVGYTYNDSSTTTNNGTSSSMKTTLESWYASNLTSYTSYINQSAQFCNDTTTPNSSYPKYFGSLVRVLEANTPTFNCPATNKTYGGLYSVAIGLITTDEALYAGGFALPNATYYLNNGTSYWTMSPFEYSFWPNVAVISANGAACSSGTSIHYTSNVRPVIELRAGLYVTGSGTVNDPWRVQ